MEELVLKYVLEMEQELVLSQGISAQSIRAGRRRKTIASEKLGRPITSRLGLPAITTFSESLPTHRSWNEDISVVRRCTRSRFGSSDTYISSPSSSPSSSSSSSYSSSSSPQIPLRMLLPANSRNTLLRPRIQNTRVESYNLTGHYDCLAAPASPNALSRESINSRFSEVQVIYIEGDCLIHNGMQMVDFGMEFATQRATPRLVSFPHTT